MKVLVTGGAGFVGSHTADALIEKGYQVRILDNLQKPVHLKGKPDYLPKSAEFILGDVRDKKTLETALEGVDAVYHFAAYQDYLPDFSTYFHVNSVSTALIYELIVEKKFPVQKVVVASSQAVLGEGLYACEACRLKNEKSTGAADDIAFGLKAWEFLPDIRSEAKLKKGEWEHKCPRCGSELTSRPTPEAFVNPKNQYALSKHSQESIAINLGKRYGIPSAALRYSIVQGPRQSFYNAYSGVNRIYCLSLFLGKSPTIFEDGRQIRDYVNIQDVVRANLLVLEKAEADDQVYNVGGGKSYTVLEFYEIVNSIFQKNIKPKIPGFYRYGDTRHIHSDISKLRALGWNPQFTPEQSVRDYKAYLEKQADIEDILDYAEKQMRDLSVIRKVSR
jgi:dTDP-L-rhamnose 4-epimerase